MAANTPNLVKGPIAYSKIPIVILAGGMGTRIMEESHLKPKPMIEIGGIPILIHIMRYYYQFGFNDFVICAGYRSSEIKHYFMNYQVAFNDFEVDHRENLCSRGRLVNPREGQERWRVKVLETGLLSMTGARVKKALDVMIAENSFEYFGLTYGDGLTDADLHSEFQYHIQHNNLGTVLGVRNIARYGELEVDAGDQVLSFAEKPEKKQDFVSGGYFFFRGDLHKYLSSDDPALSFEGGPLRQLAQNKQLKVFKHLGFWQCMDTLRDKNYLQELWDNRRAPWLISPESGGEQGVLLRKAG